MALLSPREYAPGDAKVRGAAYGCLEAANDLLELHVLGNAIPTFLEKVQRIASSLTEIAEARYDDSTVVRLGVQVAALEHRLNAAKDHVGEFAFQEASVFFAVIKDFLGQFRDWNDYRGAYAVSPEIEKSAIETATGIVKGAASSRSATTSSARAELERFASEIEPDAATKAEAAGAISTAENVLASAAAELVRQAKHEGKELTKETVQEIRRQSASGIAGWFVESLPAVARYATATGSVWLRHFIEKIL